MANIKNRTRKQYDLKSTVVLVSEIGNLRVDFFFRYSNFKLQFVSEKVITGRNNGKQTEFSSCSFKFLFHKTFCGVQKLLAKYTTGNLLYPFIFDLNVLRKKLLTLILILYFSNFRRQTKVSALSFQALEAHVYNTFYGYLRHYFVSSQELLLKKRFKEPRYIFP